ncbi:signal peptidase complex catalytic subunit SEC11A isoform X3 [Rousettus aegyptiacus]|uniref:signal peptidase complex catalytic subunit SEC11A isoform X3 n=1 Tax=Rousettus aegyptiacus TaxID=9407 RepID=UPI00168CF655|nr:signal peptidase complex catalytic subunit SEC11A isoform X3 [Rousettus aegyptiacus]
MLSLDFLDDVRRMNKRQLYYQVLNFGMIVSSALMIWKGLMVITGSESPIVVVLSGSMEPAFHRGDLLFLTNRVEDPIRVGEIVVFRIEGREIPIVHRVLKIHEKQNGHIKFLTKGDNNAVDDRGLYKQGQHWLEKKDVVGRARGSRCFHFTHVGKEEPTLGRKKIFPWKTHRLCHHWELKVVVL